MIEPGPVESVMPAACDLAAAAPSTVLGHPDTDLAAPSLLDNCAYKNSPGLALKILTESGRTAVLSDGSPGTQCH
eukprot:763371-Hanusia_phi.AAC.4